MFKWYLNRKNINNSPPHDDVISRDIKQLRKEIDDIKKPGTGITWGDTCMQKHTEIDRRLGKLENGN